MPNHVYSHNTAYDQENTATIVYMCNLLYMHKCNMLRYDNKCAPQILHLFPKYIQLQVNTSATLKVMLYIAEKTIYSNHCNNSVELLVHHIIGRVG